MEEPSQDAKNGDFTKNKPTPGSEQNGEKATFRSKLRVNEETFPLKVTLFLCYGAVSAILPYLTIHMQDLGISINEVAIIYAILPVTSFLGPLVMGFLADRFGDYKWVLIISTFGNGFCHTILLYVPVYQSGIPLSATALVHWTPKLEQSFLVPSNPLHCAGLNEVMIIGMTLRVTDCVEIPETSTRENKTISQNTTFEFRLEETYNCSGKVDRVQLYADLRRDGRGEEYVCTSNVSYWTGEKTEVGSKAMTFWTYFFMRIVSTMFMVSSLSLLDATTLAVVKRCGKAEYGREKIWSIIGCALVSPIAGTLVDRVSASKGFTDYSPAFYLCDALLLCSILSFFLIELQVDKPGKDIIKNGWKLIKYPEVLVFLTMIFLMGNLWGFVESYLFIFLKELKAPNFLLGLTLTVGSLVGIPFLWGSEKIVSKVGRVNLIIAAFFTYFIRFFGYSYLEEPFWCFPFEALEAFTVHLMWTAAATYCSLLAPKGLLASLVGVMGALHYSLGKGAGSFLGGVSYGAIGARLTFRYFGIAAGIFGIIFFVLDLFWVREIVERRLKTEKVEREEMGGKEIIFRRTSISRRESVFDANPFSQTTAMISLQEEGDEGEFETMNAK